MASEALVSEEVPFDSKMHAESSERSDEITDPVDDEMSSNTSLSRDSENSVGDENSRRNSRVQRTTSTDESWWEFNHGKYEKKSNADVPIFTLCLVKQLFLEKLITVSKS